MALPGNKNFSDYDNYITDQNPTTSAQAQDYFRNQAELLKAVIDCDFWQPETTYQPGDVVKSDSMPNGTEAVMVATKANVTSNVEPQWGEVGSANISDGACFWKLRWQHWSKEVATQAEAEAGTDNSKIMTPLRTKQSIGEFVFDQASYVPLYKGGTGAGNVTNARKNLQTNLVTFIDASQLGLSGSFTILDLAKKIGNGQMFVDFITSDMATQLGMPYGGMLTIIRDLGNFSCTLMTRGGKNNSDKFFTSNIRSDHTEASEITWSKLAENSKLSMPSSNKISLSLASGDTYIAPADGWLFLRVTAPSGSTYCDLIVQNTTSGIETRQRDNQGLNLRAYVPLAKGQSGKVEYTNGTLHAAIFVYAQSEV